MLMDFDTDPADYSTTEVHGTHDWPSTYTLTFDRTAGTGFHRALNYQIVVSWMISKGGMRRRFALIYAVTPRI
jgi:hypothetical protein